jgi:hypothetical protein
MGIICHFSIVLVLYNADIAQSRNNTSYQKKKRQQNTKNAASFHT